MSQNSSLLAVACFLAIVLSSMGQICPTKVARNELIPEKTGTISSDIPLQDIQKGVLRLKLTESFCSKMEASALRTQSKNKAMTGVQSLDNVSRNYKAYRMERVFPYAGKYERKHRKHGLHLWYEVKIDENVPVLEAVKAYSKLEGVQRAEPVLIVKPLYAETAQYKTIDKHTLQQQAILANGTNDPLFSKQWHYHNTGQNGGKPGADIQLLEAWKLETGKPDVIVAIIDEGVQVNHEDLAANMWVNADEIPGNKIDDDNNGYIDDINGYDFRAASGTIQGDRHGTHVAGTVAATTNNGIGVAGVAGGTGKGDGVRLMSCAIIQVGDLRENGLATSFIYAADNGAVIAQNSWGVRSGSDVVQSIRDAISYFIQEAGTDENGIQTGPMKGGIVLFAAGNGDTDRPSAPGGFETVVAVASTNNKDEKSDFSHYGNWVELAAPGGQRGHQTIEENVLSTFPNNEYGYLGGTSMACPHASGVAALIVSKYGGNGFTPTQVRDRLLNKTNPVTTPFPIGTGRLNAFRSLYDEVDAIAPEAIKDLKAVDINGISVRLTWTAPSDSGGFGNKPRGYEVRYSQSPITEENFQQATLVGFPIPVAVGNHGTAQTFVIHKLQGLTTYYVAIRSKDFTGNASLISNLAQVTTGKAPALIDVSTTALADTVLFKETVRNRFTIYNKGDTTLTFSIEKIGFFSAPAIVSPESGTIAPDDSLTINLEYYVDTKFARRIQLKISSNDPTTPEVMVEYTIQVISRPIVVVPDSLQFGRYFKGDTSVTISIPVKNEGSEPFTITSIKLDAPFTLPTIPLPVSIGEESGTVLYFPIQTNTPGKFDRTLVFTTNIKGKESFTVNVQVEIVSPPVPVVPDSLYVSVREGASTPASLKLKNTGPTAWNLDFHVTNSPRDTARILIIDTGFGLSDPMSEALREVPTHQVDVFPQENLGQLTLADLQPYDVVFLSSGFWDAFGSSSERIGNLMADYRDKGGKIFVHHLYNNTNENVGGRFLKDGYSPFRFSGLEEIETLSYLRTTLPNHPMLTGVDSLYTYYINEVEKASGASVLASWENGIPALGYKQGVLTFSYNPFDLTIPSLRTLYKNAVEWLVNKTPVQPKSESLTVPAYTALQTRLTIQAKNLTPGRYTPALYLASAVPGYEAVKIPVILQITENIRPEFVRLEDVSLTENEPGFTFIYATDADDYTVTLRTTGLPSFAQIKTNTSGVLALAFHPKIGDAGKYTIQVTATDPLGKSTSKNLTVTVLPFAVERFSLINRATGKVLKTFTDSVTLDASTLPLSKLAIEAHTPSFLVGSVVFMLDDKQIAVDNIPPYLLSSLPQWFTRSGTYRLEARPYTKENGTGQAGKSKQAIITVIHTPIASGLQPFQFPEGSRSSAVYPNPVSGTLHIPIESQDASSSHRITVLDMYGRTLFQEKLKQGFGGIYKLDAKRIFPTQGIYYLLVEENGSQKWNRIIKSE